MSEAIVYLTRRTSFSAAHRLHSHQLSDAENAVLFGKCNWPNGHGHNYGVELTLRGTVDHRTGILFDLDRLKAMITEIIDGEFDHKHLNLDIPEFSEINPTAENLTRVLWDRFAKRLPAGLLYEIKLTETENNTFVYRGEKIGR